MGSAAAVRVCLLGFLEASGGPTGDTGCWTKWIFLGAIHQISFDSFYGLIDFPNV